MLNSDNEEEMKEYEAQVAKAEDELRAIRENYPKSDPRDRQAIATSAMEQARFSRGWQEIRDRSYGGRRREARGVYNTRLMEATLGRRRMEDYIAGIGQKRGERLSTDALQAESVGIPAVWTMLFLTVVLGVGGFLWFARSVQRSNQQLEEVRIV
jgi:hypothetical protein